MTIGADALIDFFGTATEIDIGSGSTAVSDSTMSAGATDIDEWTNADDAPMAAFMLTFDVATNTTASRTIGLYAALQDIVGESGKDADIPTTTFLHTFIGNFYPKGGIDTEQDVPGVFLLPNTVSQQKYQFYLFNNCGVEMSAGWALWINTKTRGPHA